ncbi:hypothetical protein ACEWY4_008553 [Coilia grayii]|uniref:DUF8040 domain-containing protein n=1 Tax=Coilia grayii TaxID=363190 RepID=A0ABD1KB71_9TELE
MDRIRILNMLIVLCQLITAVITLRRRVRARRRLELMMLIQGLDTPYRASPQTWQRPRSSLWWENDVLGNFTDSEWLTSFRMTRQTFERLCNLLPSLQPDPSSRRPPVPHQKRVAIAIYKLASCCEYRVVAGKFGVSITTIHHCVYAVCRAITSKLLHQYVKMPSADEAQQIAYRNAMKHHIPQIYGAIDGSHIPIVPPPGRIQRLHKPKALGLCDPAGSGGRSWAVPQYICRYSREQPQCRCA